MRYTNTPLKLLIILTCLIVSIIGYAVDSNALEKQANSSIQALYHTLNTKPINSMTQRIDWFSKHFLGKVYILGSLGEGPTAQFDQYPRYRMDGFDCDTYVNTVLALALANSLPSFQQCSKSVRYKNGRISYINRNHFTSLDWNKNNQKLGILKDITLSIKDEQKHSPALMSTTLINKPGWYAHKNTSTIRLSTNGTADHNLLLEELKKQGSQLERVETRIPYIPLSALFNSKNEPNQYLFSQIPDGSIIEIIRPNWDLRKLIGTSIDVSHLGFAIRHKGQLNFRQASSQYGKVVEVSLINYLRDARVSPTIKGINVQVIVPQRVSRTGCGGF